MGTPFSTSPEVLLDLHSNRLHVALPDGRAVAVPVELPPDATAWREALTRATPHLRRAVEELGIAGARATLVYRSPTQGVALESVAVASAGEAEEAALLAVSDQLSYAAALANSRSLVIRRDKHNGRTRSHVIVTADHDDTLSCLAKLVRESGLELEGAVPRDALLLARTVQEAEGCPDRVAGRVRIGDWASYLVVTGPAGLAFARRISIGLSTLVRSLVGSASGDDIELDFDEAAAILREHGVPDPSVDIDPARGISGRRIRARLQSTLQRLVVELRQSLRFGLTESERADFALHLTGPGASMPRLAEALAAELELPIDVCSDSPYWPKRGQDGSDLVHATRQTGLVKSLLLLPSDESRSRVGRRYRRWLWTGTVAAMAMVALDGFRQYGMLENVQREADVLRSTQAVHDALEATGKRLREAINSMEALETTLDNELGQRPPIDAALKEISVLLPPELRLSRIDVSAGTLPVKGSLAGVAFAPQDSRTALPEFVAALRSSAIFDTARLGDVSSITIVDHDALRFQVDFTLVCVPRDTLPDVGVIAAVTEASP